MASRIMNLFFIVMLYKPGVYVWFIELAFMQTLVHECACVPRVLVTTDVK